MRKTKSDNRGASLVVVIITIAFIGILVSMIMYISFMNFTIKAADVKNKNSFYTAENALDEIKAGLQGEVSESMGSAYMDIMQNYGMYSDDERTETFEWKYMTFLRDTLKVPGADGRYRVQVLTDYLQETAWDASTGTGATISAETATDGVLLMLEDGVVLKDVTVTYVSADGNVSRIKTDIRLALPQVSFNESFKLPDVLSYCMIANNNLYVTGGNNSFIGSLYGGRNGIEIKSGSTANMSKADLLVTDAAVTVNNASLVVAEDCNLWAENIVVDSANLSLLGSTYVGDDLTIDGSNSKVKISNTYYGYGYGGSGESALGNKSKNDVELASAEHGGIETASLEYETEYTVDETTGMVTETMAIDLSQLEYSGIEETAYELNPYFGFYKNKDGSVTVYVQDLTQEINPGDVTPMLHLRGYAETQQYKPGLAALPYQDTLALNPELGPNYYSCVISKEYAENVIYFHFTYYPYDTRIRTDSGVLATVVSGIKPLEPETEVQPPEVIEPEVQNPVDEAASHNSSILINGLHTSLDMSGVQRLYLAGNGFINTAAAGTVTIDGESKTNESVFLGESLAVKSEQIAYLVPTECLWVLNGESLCNTNPVPVDMIANYEAQGAKEVSLGTQSDVLGSALGNYAQNYQKVYRVVEGAKLVYYYLTFTTAEDASEFFKAYYEADKERMDQYLKVYVDSLKLPVDSMIRVNLAGNVFGMENGKFVLNDATVATDDNAELKLESDGYANTFAQLCTTLSRVEPTAAQEAEKTANGIFYNIVDREEFDKLVPGVGTQQVIYNMAGDMGVVVVNNAGGSVYQMNGDGTVVWDEIKILLASGDVIVDHNFKGIVIAGGTITVQGGVTIDCDPDGVSEAMKIDTFLNDGTASTVVNLFVEGNYVYNQATTQVGGVQVQTADLVRFENWSKE